MHDPAHSLSVIMGGIVNDAGLEPVLQGAFIHLSNEVSPIVLGQVASKPADQIGTNEMVLCKKSIAEYAQARTQECHDTLIKEGTMDDSRSGPVFIPVDMELLSAYIDGELDYKTEAEIEHRLQEDPRAQSIVAQYRKLDSLLHRSFDPLPDDANQRCTDIRQTRWLVRKGA